MVERSGKVGRPATRTGPPEPVRAVVRGLRLLEALAERPSATLAELAAATGLGASTTHRLLATLVGEGYVSRDAATQRYRLGHRVAALSRSAAMPTEALRAAAGPHMTALRDAFDETVNLVVLDGSVIVYVDQAESARPVRMFSRIGNRVPAHASGGGKAILAQLPPDRLDELLGTGPLAALTARTVTDPGELRARLDDVRERGWALDDGEYDESVVCVAAAIPAASAALTISGPAERLRTLDLAAAGERVVAAAARVGDAL